MLPTHTTPPKICLVELFTTMFAGCYYTFQYLFGVLYMEGLYNIFQSKTVLADPKRGASTWQVVSKVANFSGNIFRKAEISPQHMLRVLPVFSRERILRIYLSAFRRSTLLVNIRERDKKCFQQKNIKQCFHQNIAWRMALSRMLGVSSRLTR